MKTCLLLPVFIVALTATTVRAQSLPVPVQEQHTVAVTGTATISLKPDEIYVATELKEFTKDRKVVTLNELETGVRNYAQKICSIPAADITVDAANPAASVKSTGDAMRTLQIKCTDPEQAAKLFSVIDSLGIERMNIRHITSSKLAESKTKVKGEAVKDAKEKAGTLLSAIGYKAGDLQTLTEFSENQYNENYYDQYSSYRYGSKAGYGRSMTINSTVDGSSANEVKNMINTVRNFSIKVGFTVGATFAIVK